MFAILFSWGLIFIITCAIGDMIIRLLSIKKSLPYQFILGFTGVTFYAQLVSLFSPFNSYPLIFLTDLVLIYSFFIKNFYIDIFNWIKYNKNAVILSLPLFLYGFLLAQEPPLNYDTNLYHFQSILWSEQYAVVPGLANLYGPQGYNNSILVVHSMFALRGLFNQPVFAINLFLYTLGVIVFVKNIYKNIQILNSNYLLAVANVLLLIAFVSLTENIASPTPDFVANSILMLLLADCLNDKDKRPMDWIPVIITCAYLITIKLSMVPVVILALYGLYQLLIAGFKKAIVLTSAAVSVFLMIWFTRNVILTGWLVYPFYHIDIFNVDWKVQLNQIVLDANAIKGWSRYPGLDISITSKMKFMEWFPVWWKRASLGKIYMVISCCSILFSIFYFTFKNKTHNTRIKILTLTIISGFIFWFIMAPDFRFCIGFIFHLMILPLFLIELQNNNIIKTKRVKILPNVVAIVVTIYIVALYAGRWQVIANNISPSWISGRWKVPKTLDYVGRQPMDSFYLENHVFYYPRDVNKNMDMRCYDQCLPCIPSKNSSIGFRGKTLQEGFYRKTQHE
jgi:hypothetical protein